MDLSPASSEPLFEQLLNDMPMHIGETSFDTVVIGRQPRVIDTQLVQSCRVQVVAVGGILHGLVTEFIGGPVSDSALDTATGKPCCESSGIVISAFSRATLSGWLPSLERDLCRFKLRPLHKLSGGTGFMYRGLASNGTPYWAGSFGVLSPWRGSRIACYAINIGPGARSE